MGYLRLCLNMTILCKSFSNKKHLTFYIVKYCHLYNSKSIKNGTYILKVKKRERERVKERERERERERETGRERERERERKKERDRMTGHYTSSITRKALHISIVKILTKF